MLNGYKTKDAYEDGEDIEVFCATHASARPLDIDIRWSGSGIETADSEDIRLGDLEPRFCSAYYHSVQCVRAPIHLVGSV